MSGRYFLAWAGVARCAQLVGLGSQGTVFLVSGKFPPNPLSERGVRAWRLATLLTILWALPPRVVRYWCANRVGWASWTGFGLPRHRAFLFGRCFLQTTLRCVGGGCGFGLRCWSSRLSFPLRFWTPKLQGTKFHVPSPHFTRRQFRRMPKLQASRLHRKAAEADGNRTRRGTFAPPMVLKTTEPTRRSFASPAGRVLLLAAARSCPQITPGRRPSTCDLRQCHRTVHSRFRSGTGCTARRRRRLPIRRGSIGLGIEDCQVGCGLDETPNASLIRLLNDRQRPCRGVNRTYPGAWLLIAYPPYLRRRLSGSLIPRRSIG